MVLEAVMICVDSSEWMRNGDYNPSRLEAQHDAATLIAGNKLNSNPENTVGLISSAGRVEVLSTLDGQASKIITNLHRVKIYGKLNFCTSIQIAQLALKHRQNKNQRQRIVVFVGSPIEASEQDIIKCAKKLKKNNVSVDIINFGEEAENVMKLEAFVSAVNNKEGTSHLLTVPPGPHILSDIILSSPLICEDGQANNFEFGVDPTMDPELALALRVSLEEENMRQEQRNQSSQSSEIKAQPVESSQTSSESTSKKPTSASLETDMLAKAMAMSMHPQNDGMEDVQPFQGHQELTEDEQIAMALQLSMQQDQAQSKQPSTSQPLQKNPPADDEQFLKSVLQSLPGVNPDDKDILQALHSLKESDKNKPPEKDKKK